MLERERGDNVTLEELYLANAAWDNNVKIDVFINGISNSGLIDDIVSKYGDSEVIEFDSNFIVLKKEKRK